MFFSSAAGHVLTAPVILAMLLPRYTPFDTLHAASKVETKIYLQVLFGRRGWLNQFKIYDDILLDRLITYALGCKICRKQNHFDTQ